MKITDFLIQDHSAMRALLMELDALTHQPPSEELHNLACRLVAQVKDRLLVHRWVEDELVYPEVWRLTTEKHVPANPEVQRHLEKEHLILNQFLEKLSTDVNQRPMLDHWKKSLNLLSTLLQSHFTREEEDFFPLMEKSLGLTVLEALTVQAEKKLAESLEFRI